MSPPLHITGVPVAEWLVFIVGFALALYWFRALRLAREGARLFLSNVAKALLIFCGLMMIFTAIRPQTHLQPHQEQVIGGFLALVLFARFQGQRRSRYIPKAVRRAVITRDLKGAKFDSQRH